MIVVKKNHLGIDTYCLMCHLDIHSTSPLW